MELNATLIVQAVHFFVAYVIIDRVLLRSAIGYIHKEEQKVAALEHQVALQEQKIAEQTRHNEQDWTILQKRLRAECPDIQSELRPLGTLEPLEAEPFIADFNKEQAVNRFKEVIVRKVINVDS